MDATQRPWWARLLRRTPTLFVIAFAFVFIEQLCGPARTSAARGDLLDRLQEDRASRVIAMIHRQDTVSLFGVPVSSSIGIEDSEAVLRAIRLTPPDQPIDRTIFRSRWKRPSSWGSPCPPTRRRSSTS